MINHKFFTNYMWYAHRIFLSWALGIPVVMIFMCDIVSLPYVFLMWIMSIITAFYTYNEYKWGLELEKKYGKK